MHPFGGTPYCARCEKAVYAAEQIMGPGRKIYHKPCLTCTTCGTRLDSFKLVEHRQEPYCKPCHVKNFGTTDLRQANLPGKAPIPSTVTYVSRAIHTPNPLDSKPYFPSSRNNTMLSESPTSSPSASPTSSLQNLPQTNGNGANGYGINRPESPTRSMSTGEYLRSSSPIRANAPWKRPTSPVRSFSPPPAAAANRRISEPPVSAPNGNGIGLGGYYNSRANPISPASTGSSYSPTKYKFSAGGGGAVCPACQKVVYFAEQVKASNRTWHKACLRCTECKASLASGRLADKEGVPYCHKCYSKLHGPQGSGYALLGKAGSG